MHIPDGYLGPHTYIAFWILMIPIWYFTGQKLSAELKSKQIPLLTLSAAFSFVIMMFNIPVPGGSTGHAVGGGIIAIVIGPWAAIIAISTNCFNMGVVVLFVAYYAYKLIGGNSEITSSTRVIAAAIGDWFSLTTASFCAGIKLGIQPILEHTADGTPLYMPYT